MFRVLIPSLFITNPLTLNLYPSFWVIRSFPIPLETIKRGGDFYFDLYKSSQSNGLVLNISTAKPPPFLCFSLLQPQHLL